MNERDSRFLNQAQTVVIVAGLLVSAGVLPRSWKKSLAIAGATIVLVGLLAE